MPDITIRIGAAAEAAEAEAAEKKVQTSIVLNARKTLEGNVVIFDHDMLDIVIIPNKNKVLAFPKTVMGDHVYNAQDRLFDFMNKKGAIKLGSIQGGNIYGSIEAEYPDAASEGVDPVQVVLLTISKFLDLERPYFGEVEDHLDDFKDYLTDPEEEESTELGEVPHGETKGSLRPGWIRTPYAHTRMYRA